MATFVSLPNEVLAYMFQSVTTRDLARVVAVDRRLCIFFRQLVRVRRVHSRLRIAPYFERLVIAWRGARWNDTFETMLLLDDSMIHGVYDLLFD